MARIFPLRFGLPPRRDRFDRDEADRSDKSDKTGKPGKGKRPRLSRTGALMRAGLILLLCGLIGFSVYQVARHMTVGLSTLRTQEIVDESYVELELYLFRDEALISAAGSGVTQYAVSDGERVGVGATLGTAYAAGGMTDSALDDLQTRLNACSDRIAILQEIGGHGTPADVRDTADAVDRYYLALLDAAADGDLSAVNGYADGMLDGIGRYASLTGADGADSVSALRAEQARLLSGLSSVATLTTDRGGYFYYEADGYETAFPYAAAMTMTAAEFLSMTETSATAVPTDTVGKMVYSATWYAAAYIPIDDPAVEVFQQGIASGATYRMTCPDSAGTEVDLTIRRFEQDGEGVLLVFSSQDMPTDFDFTRKVKMETVSHTESGYRIPTEALVTLHSDKTGEDVPGVYILAGGVVEFRKVRIQVRRDGYVIADTYEEVKAILDGYTDEQYAAATADGWSYLQLNDNIIIGGNELHEGKMIS